MKRTPLRRESPKARAKRLSGAKKTRKPLERGGRIRQRSPKTQKRREEAAKVCKTFLETITAKCEITVFLDEFDPPEWRVFKRKHPEPEERDPHHVVLRKNGTDPRLLVAALRPAHDYAQGKSVKAGTPFATKKREGTKRLGRFVSVLALEKGKRFDPAFVSKAAGYDVCGVIAIEYANGNYDWCPLAKKAVLDFLGRWHHVIGQYGPRYRGIEEFTEGRRKA